MDVAAAAEFGLAPEDLDQEECEIWPENERAVGLFGEICNQWRVGMGGAYALDYCAVYPLLDRRAKTPEEWDDLFACVQVMETAGLRALRE